ncbi:DUF3105 domain-containing protein [Candidatus Collierbacteria bacterium]|nr:DUF3105 domain-containing protein [Candidatus Collierbacteria bacterium]
MNRLLKTIGFILLLVVISAGGIFILTRKPKAVEGIETFPSQGRNHVPAGTIGEYNSNPPTSGPHYTQWEKPGIYNKVLPDGNLIHSLEHGYVIISYDCTKLSNSKLKTQSSKFWKVFAHETEEIHEEPPATDSADVKPDNISGWKDSPDCQKLVDQIKQVTKKTGMDRLIVVPRPNLDVPIAMTSWTKLLKLNDVNEDKIINFVKEFRNKGPEKTME